MSCHDQPLRVAQAHCFYQQRGGEEVVLEEEQALLVSGGHEVVQYTASNDDIRGLASKLDVFLTVHRNPRAAAAFGAWLDQTRPDIVHVHNFFPLLSPSIYEACAERRLPVVQSLHNFRTLCANGFFFRDGNTCERCLGGRRWPALRHRCYRGSLAGTWAVTGMIKAYPRASAAVTRFIALTEFSRAKLIEGGFDADRVVVKPNFLRDPGLPPPGPRRGALFVGRHSIEKGLSTMIAAWHKIDHPLSIAGSGPLTPMLREAAGPGVEMLGALDRVQVRRRMLGSEFLVVPSIGYETFGLVVIEAFASGLPVLAARRSSLAEIVEDGRTGLHFRPGDADDLAEKARWLIGHPEEARAMGARARAVYEAKYTPAPNYRQLIAIYGEALAACGQAGRI